MTPARRPGGECNQRFGPVVNAVRLAGDQRLRRHRPCREDPDAAGGDNVTAPVHELRVAAGPQGALMISAAPTGCHGECCTRPAPAGT